MLSRWCTRLGLLAVWYRTNVFLKAMNMRLVRVLVLRLELGGSVVYFMYTEFGSVDVLM